jgi:O-antigen ligase
VGVTERIPKGILVAAVILGVIALAYLAYSRPGYFTSQIYLGGILLLECLAAGVWMYRRVFFPLIAVAFLLAGVDLPVGAFWSVLRWVFLAVGALSGTFLVFKERSHHFGLIHVVAMFAILSALASAAVSQFPQVALLKALSLLLLFLYGSTGARLAVTGRESQFFTGLLLGCEVFIGTLVGFYAIGIEMMGNPNSLGAVTGIVLAPVLLWGAFLEDTPFVQRRRFVLYAACMYLVFHSHARAGMATALISSGVLCIALRKYGAVIKGAVVILVLASASAILQPENFSNAISSLKTSVIYKGGAEGSLLASRASPWQSAIDSIHTHFWFGTGLGTVETNKDPKQIGIFSSNSNVTAENGSSYLAILSGVGVLGALPFSFLLLLLLGKSLRTLLWLAKTGNPCQPAVPLALIIVAGLFHAGFEDWLFAPGNYLCVWFWSLAFIFADIAPSSVPQVAFAWRFRGVQRGFGVAPSR